MTCDSMAKSKERCKFTNQGHTTRPKPPETTMPKAQNGSKPFAILATTLGAGTPESIMRTDQGLLDKKIGGYIGHTVTGRGGV